MTLGRGTEGSDPIGPEPVGGAARIEEERRVRRSSLLAEGTLACPACSAPVAPARKPMSIAERLSCPVCDHGAPVRDFLSLADPSRPARVALRLRRRSPVVHAAS